MAGHIAFDDVGRADLYVDATYKSLPGVGMAGEPLSRMFRVANQSGFRPKRVRPGGSLLFVVLYSTLENPDWPDRLDEEEGVFVYYGDNKRPGDLHRTSKGGNKILAFETFGELRADPPDRIRIPPFFVFTKAGEGLDAVFRGLAVPGVAGLSPLEDLVAVWKSKDGERFQNYKAHFTILDVPQVRREWIDDLLAGQPVTANAPPAWLDWVTTGRYRALRAAPTVNFRSKAEQLPMCVREERMLTEVYDFYAQQPHGFERCSGELFRMMDRNVVDYELTRPWRDRGRDAIGHYRIGTAGEPVKVDFALEAKCYRPGQNSVGVREMSRLISRLQHRQFGVMVTTSFVHKQAYQEVAEDGHPVLIVAGRDITEILTNSGYPDERSVQQWLRTIA